MDFRRHVGLKWMEGGGKRSYFYSFREQLDAFGLRFDGG